MTRWLAAARRAEGLAGAPGLASSPRTAAEVSSGSSVLSGGREASAWPASGRPKPSAVPKTLARHSDAQAYLAHLTHRGPATVGAAAAALGWGATRAWQAEARLRAAGLVKLGPSGRAEVR